MMNTLKKMPGFILLLLLLPLSHFSQSSLPETQLIYNANIVDVITGKLKKERALLIEHNTIKAIGDYKTLSVNVDPANQLDAKNKYVIPGLWDNHIHLEQEHLVEDNEALIPIFLAYGVTTVRDCASDLGIQVLKWREMIKQGKLTGPTIFTAGLKLEGINSSWKGDLEIANEDELRHMMDKLDSMNVDFIKITENTLQGPLFLGSIKEAHKRGYIVSGHVPMELTIEEMFDAGFSSIEHSSYLLRLGCDEKTIVEKLKAGNITRAEANNLYHTTFNQETANKNYKRLAKKGLTVTPTLIGGRQMIDLDKNNHLGDSMMTSYLTNLYSDTYRKALERATRNTEKQKEERKAAYRLNASQLPYFQKAGIRILAGSDEAAMNNFIYPGESLVEELQIYQDAGLSPVDVLKTATINGALFLKKQTTMGSLDPGKVADIVILDKNPLEDISAVKNVNAVFARGKYFDRDALTKILMDVRNAKIRLDTQRAGK